MTTFYFVRHANAYDENWVQTPESHLNEDGRKQAEALQRVLEAEEFDAILVSPYQRAQDTYHIAAKDLQLEAITLDDLREFGSNSWPNPTDLFVSPEIKKDFDGRKKVVAMFFNELKANYAGKKVLIFGHGNWIRVLIAVILDLDARVLLHFHIDFASVTVVEVSDNGMVGIPTVSGDYAQLAMKLKGINND